VPALQLFQGDDRERVTQQMGMCAQVHTVGTAAQVGFPERVLAGRHGDGQTVLRQPERGRLQARWPISISHLLHELARLGIANSQVDGLEARPASLALGKAEVLGLAHDLTHACVSEQM
jgi:hypothetical protein